MILHKDPKLMSQLIRFTSDKYNINPRFIEKDYWITYVLSNLSKSEYMENAVFKGGTSLSKGYELISRFSEDVDIALFNQEAQSGNKVKSIIRNIEKEITSELQEIELEGITSKGSRFRKSVYAYNSFLGKTIASQNNVIVEINSFANPYPNEKLKIESYIAKFLKETNNEDSIEEFRLQEFSINVLDKRQTLIEKIVSLIRFSHLGTASLALKIRHFYDLHFLFNDEVCNNYIHSSNFKPDFYKVLEHDKLMFETPTGWQESDINQLPLFTNTNDIWKELEPTYTSELSDLAFTEIPDPGEILDSFNKLVRLIIKQQ